MQANLVRRQQARSPWGLILGVGTALLMVVALYLMFIYAPTDLVQGDSQRIFYIHVPMAWVAYLSAFILFVASIAFLWKGNQRWDRVGRASAELALIFTTLVLVTGSLWGRPIWGTWWTWDARLSSTLLLWFILLGYFMIRSYVGDPDRGARYAAVVGIIGFLDVPIIHMSVTWWRTMHPEPIVVRAEGPNMPGEMVLALMVSLAAFTLLYAYLMYEKLAIERAKDDIAAYRYAEAEREADGDVGEHGEALV